MTAPASGVRLSAPPSARAPSSGRFEVRAARTGYLQEAFARIPDAIQYALRSPAAGGPHCFIVDLALPVQPNDPRIVWLDVSPAPAALEWLAAHCLHEV